MPSPFPGMDPYLEDSVHWPSVHLGLTVNACYALVAQLRPRYFVDIKVRSYISRDGDPGRNVLIPKVHFVKRSRLKKAVSVGRTSREASVAVAEPFETITVLDEEICEKYIEISEMSDERVVTRIEILNPANKVLRSAK